MDPHSAVGYSVLQKYREGKPEIIPPPSSRPQQAPLNSIVPYSRPSEGIRPVKTSFSLLQELSSIVGQVVPAKLAELTFLPEVHQGVCEREGWRRLSLNSWALNRISDVGRPVDGEGSPGRMRGERKEGWGWRGFEMRLVDHEEKMRCPSFTDFLPIGNCELLQVIRYVRISKTLFRGIDELFHILFRVTWAEVDEHRMARTRSGSHTCCIVGRHVSLCLCFLVMPRVRTSRRGRPNPHPRTVR